MTLRIQRNSDGSLQIDNATHLVNLMCDVCGATASSINVNTQMSYAKDFSGTNVGILCDDSVIGGTCNSTTCWPLANGTADAQALVSAKTV